MIALGLIVVGCDQYPRPSRQAPKGEKVEISQEAMDRAAAKFTPTLDDYKKTGRFIGSEKRDSIYVKAFVKSPDRFRGERVIARVKVMDIHERDGQTVMNAYLTPNLEVTVITYKGSIDVYDGDIITVYGDATGTIDGTNGLGAHMSWPGIEARFIKIFRKAER
jgi:hypothetical protein